MAQTKATEKPQADAPQPTSAEETARREVRILDNEMAGEVQAHIVRMVQSGAETITGSEVTLQQSAAQAIRGQRVEMRQSGAQLVEGQQVTLSQSGTLALRADTVTIAQGGAAVVTAQEAKLNNSQALAVIGQQHLVASWFQYEITQDYPYISVIFDDQYGYLIHGSISSQKCMSELRL